MASESGSDSKYQKIDGSDPEAELSQPVYRGPHTGKTGCYLCFIRNDDASSSAVYDHEIIFRGDEFVVLSYKSLQNIGVCNVNEADKRPFLESIRREEWPLGFTKKEGAHRISVTRLYDIQDLLEYIRPSPQVQHVEDYDSDDDIYMEI